MFKYSLHVVDENGKQKHFGFVYKGKDDPAIEVCKSLKKIVGDTGSVLVWNKSFEMGRNKEMAEMYPEYDEFLLGINKRVYDLADIFSKGYFIDPDCCGSYSVKNILPVLVPEMQKAYKDMEIGKGDEAMVAWWKMTRENLTDKEKERIKNNLFKYCELDTLAMVEIWKKLVDINKSTIV